MSYCVAQNSSGALILDNTSTEVCSSGLILLSFDEYQLIRSEGIVTTLLELFEFSTSDFLYFNAVCLVAFISGHALGRVARILGKV